jgi:hypothetical protein
VDTVVRNGLVSQGISFDFSGFRGLPADQLTEQLNQKFLHGQMSAAMKNSIISTLSHLPASSDPDVQARTAIYLVLTSSQFQVVQ